jgi:hypothetical protein
MYDKGLVNENALVNFAQTVGFFLLFSACRFSFSILILILNSSKEISLALYRLIQLF